MLDDLQSFEKLFEPPKAQSLDELEARAAPKARKYGRSVKLNARRVGTKSSSEEGEAAGCADQAAARDDGTGR